MKAISLWQPWASAMAMRLKKNETRGRLTHYRGDVAIHAAKRIQFVEHLSLDEQLKMPLGGIICIVEIYDCISAEFFSPHAINPAPPLRAITELEFKWGNYGPGRFAWLTRNLRVLKTSVPVKGRQGFWNLSPELEARIKEQIK